MEDIIQIAELALSQNPSMPEAQKELFISLSLIAMIPTAVFYIGKEIMNKIK